VAAGGIRRRSLRRAQLRNDRAQPGRLQPGDHPANSLRRDHP